MSVKLIHVSFIFSLLFTFSTIQVFAEGTKELMPDSASNRRAFVLIANGNVGGNFRDPFAIYNGDTNYRLFIHISNHQTEKIYFGLGVVSGTGSSTNWRIHAPNGTVVWSGSTPIAVGQPGFIRYYSQAYAGPTKLSPQGYQAVVVDPLMNGNYYMTFQVNNGQSRSYEKIDISVIDTTTNTYKKGRVYSKAWQLNTNEPSAHGFYGFMYVYSQDSIVTKFDPNGFDGRWFTVSCNNSGCYPVGAGMPATEARKSTEGWHNYPQYKIFLNDPDTLVYPSGIIGQVVIPPPPGSIVIVTPHCADGKIDFTFEVTSSGTITLNLELSAIGPGYVDKEVIQNVTVGQNTMVWDGYDASVPPKLVPSGSTFPFTLTYVKGMTHLPLWDVENNQNGFAVSLIRPAATSEPAFYWDDTNLSPPMPPGPVISPPGGCLSSISPCHIWYQNNGQPGDGRTVNTWWFVSNTTTVPVTIMKEQIPGIIGTISGVNQICQGSNAQFTCPADINSQQYIWTWPGGTDTTSSPFIIITIDPSTLPGPGQITVQGLNNECGEGPVTVKNITINQLPSVTNSLLIKTICSNTSPNIALQSNVSGSTFAWRVWSTNPSLAGFFNSSGSIINQNLFNLGSVTDTVRYRVAATANGCRGDSVTFKIAVHPIANLSNSPKFKQQCNNLNTNITLTSSISGTLFTWTCTPSSGNVTGWSNNSTPTTILDQTLVNSGTLIQTVIYHITPSANGCAGQVTNYTVTVYPTPLLTNSPAVKGICQGESTNIVLTSNVPGTAFTWTCTQTSGNLSGWSANPGPPTTLINQTLSLAGVATDSVIYHVTPRANNCTGPLIDYKVMVNPIPQLTLSSMVDSICSEATTAITLTSTVTTTAFSWTSANGVGSVSGFSDGTGPVIAQQLTNQDPTAGSVLYTITPSTGNCTGNSEIFTQWVKPLPHLTNKPKEVSICSNTGPNVTLTSGVTNTWFGWTATGSSVNISGYSDQTTPTTLLNQTLVNTGYDLEWVTYQVAPTAAGCMGPDSNFVVRVYPVPDLANNPPDTGICSAQPTALTLLSNITGTLFTWSATGSSGNVTGFSDQSTPTDFLDQTLTNSGYDIEWVTYQVTPTANGCDGSLWTYTVTVYPVPDVSNSPMTKEICNNNNTDIDLLSNVSGTLFTWTATGSSSNIQGFTDNTTPVTHIGDNLINLGDINETVTYFITPHANGCDGAEVEFVVTVVPSPFLTNTPLRQNQCNNLNTNIALQSNVAGTGFSWICTQSSGNITGYSNSSAPGSIINQLLVNSSFNTDSVIYHLTPENSGCPGSVTDFSVVVFPVPDVFFIPNGETVCEGELSNLSLQSNTVGATYSWTATASSVNLAGYSNGTGDLIAQTINNAGATIEWVTYLVTPTANGCPPGTTMPVILTVNPRPAVTAVPGGQSICNGQGTSLSLQSDVPGSTFAWRAFSTSTNLTGFTSSSGANIVQILNNSGYTIETVTYRVAATANNCTGDSTDIVVTVFPVADILFVPNGESICSGKITNLSLQSNVAGTSFSWTATGSSPDVSGYFPGSGNSIQQTLINTGYMMPWVTYQVAPTANGCIGTPNSAIVTVNPLPVVTLSVCFDTLTTTQAQPFELKGTNPSGGTFSGTGVTGSTFFPAIAGVGIHHIRYTYTNNFGCIDSASTAIHILDPLSLSCGDTLIDIRDNQSYPTVQIGTQCWIATNLNFGSIISSSQMQRDNCVNEKYCYNDSPSNCNSYGGLYQWDEGMRYVADNGAQGLCPPGWHIPTEPDWSTLFNALISSGFAGNALKYNGYSGFNALMTGIRFQNSVWKFPGSDLTLRSKLYWSSTAWGIGKAWAHGMNEVVIDIEYTPSVSFYPSARSNAFAIRCIKD